jgi:hypothetical protein
MEGKCGQLRRQAIASIPSTTKPSDAKISTQWREARYDDVKCANGVTSVENDQSF